MQEKNVWREIGRTSPNPHQEPLFGPQGSICGCEDLDSGVRAGAFSCGVFGFGPEVISAGGNTARWRVVEVPARRLGAVRVVLSHRFKYSAVSELTIGKV